MPLLTVPYCTSAEFADYPSVGRPTFLELLDARAASPFFSHQPKRMDPILLMASEWCDQQVFGVDGTLTAHTRTDSRRVRADRYGRLRLHPDHIPFISLASLSTGTRIGQQTSYTTPAVFAEDARSITVDLGSGTSSWSGPLQFGVPGGGAELLSSWTYLAGYPNTTLTAPTAAGALTVSVANVIGVLPGQVLRIIDPNLEEPVTVAPTWVPATGPGTLPLTTGTLYAHQNAVATRVSTLPRTVTEATILYAIATLMRPNTQGLADDAYPDMRGGVGSGADARKPGSKLVTEAQRLLTPFTRTAI